MTKEERRQLFEAQVRAQDEMNAEIRRQQEEYLQARYAENPNYDPRYDPNLAQYYQQEQDPNFTQQDPSFPQDPSFQPQDPSFQYTQDPSMPPGSVTKTTPPAGHMADLDTGSSQAGVCVLACMEAYAAGWLKFEMACDLCWSFVYRVLFVHVDDPLHHCKLTCLLVIHRTYWIDVAFNFHNNFHCSASFSTVCSFFKYHLFFVIVSYDNRNEILCQFCLV